MDGSIDDNVLRSRIGEALDTFSTLVTDQTGVQSMQVNDIELLNDGNDSGIIGGESNDREVSNVDKTVLIGAVATGLGVFLLTMTWVVASQREQRAAAHAHSRFEDEVEDQSRSFHPGQLVSSDSGVYKEEDDDDAIIHRYETTIIPVQNERSAGRGRGLQPAGVSFEDWSPFSDEGNDVPFDEAEDIYWTNHPRDRVHQCSAATCEVCERRRQQGLLHSRGRPFHVAPQAPPSPERVPTYDPDRWFVSGDTVQL